MQCKDSKEAETKHVDIVLKILELRAKVRDKKLSAAEREKAQMKLSKLKEEIQNGGQE